MDTTVLNFVQVVVLKLVQVVVVAVVVVIVKVIVQGPVLADVDMVAPVAVLVETCLLDIKIEYGFNKE